jgi:AraC-like DNA-binding protein
VLEGEGEIFLDGEWKRVQAGQMYILRGEDEHRYRALPANPWKKIWINYRADYILSFMDAYGIKSGIYKCEGAKNYFEAAFEFVRFGNMRSEICKTLAECVHKIISLAAESLDDVSDGTQNLVAVRIRQEIGNSLYTKLDLSLLAEKFYMSKSNVIRVFKKNYGLTPYEYLISLKIEAAKSLLLGTQMTVREIADRLCISDEHYFSNLFFKRVGVRPVDFRKR